MAIRRVTGAVSPSELIFADANALGATYDGSGTTIERGETFTLPAGGTTAVSNGALRLEALKGDCTITNNGNSTLTNASGVDGTIVMRSGASDFPAFVRNSSLGSMSAPAREDFTGSLTNSLGTFSGTVNGTIGSDATFPSGTITNYVSQTTQPTGTQTLTTRYQDVLGARIQSYIPTAGASKVYYSVNVRTSHTDDSRGIGSFQLYLDDVAQGGESGFSTDNNTSTSFGQYITYHTLISTSGWVGAKDVVLRARDYSTSYDVLLHYNPNHHQQDDGTDSIRYNKVHTIIYSIM